jgi:hypothetical protein
MSGMTTAKENRPVDLKDKTLLILTPSYPNEDESFIAETFVKYQVAELKQYFKKVIVIAPVLRSFGYLKKDKLCKDYTYDNVEVYFPRSIYIPICLAEQDPDRQPPAGSGEVHRRAPPSF